MASAKLQNANCGVFCGGRLLEGGNAPRAVVATERVVVAAVAPGVTLVGLNVALDADGNPDAEKEIEFGKPPTPGVAVMVKDAVCPAVTVTADGGPLTEKSSGVMMVGFVAVSFAKFVSPPPDTVAMFVTLAGAFAATVTVNVIGGKLAPTVRVSLREQIRFATTQFHPAPAIAVAVSPVGKVSVTETGTAVVAREPLFVATMV